MDQIQTEVWVLGAFNRGLHLGTDQFGWPILTNGHLVCLFEFPLQPWLCHRFVSFGKKLYSLSPFFSWVYKTALVIYFGGGGE